MGIPEKIGKYPVLPILNLTNPENGLRTAEALADGGIEIMEVTLRNEDALPSLKAIRKEFPHFTLGAGTILNVEQLDRVENIGVDFGVSPGWDEALWNKAIEKNFFLIPGILTPSELNRVSQFDCPLIKVFPIQPAGGYPYLHALLAPFRSLGRKYIPTGGITPKLVSRYLSDPDVLLVGGSWITPCQLLQTSQFQKITELAKSALSFPPLQ